MGPGLRLGTDLRRWWLAGRARGAALQAYYRADLPRSSAPWTEAEFLALDLETTGLKPQRDAILSIGWVPVVAGAADLSGAGHTLVAAGHAIGEQSAAVHGILEQHLADAPALDGALAQLLAALAGRIPVAHHAAVESGFLNAACRRIDGAPLVTPWVDTLKLEMRAFDRRGRPPAEGELRLDACRERHGLPRYRAHHALVDALACAELFLAQAAGLGGKRPARVGDLT